jgi:hypothetical protein
LRTSLQDRLVPHVNSLAYWDTRFRTDWSAMGGEAQSRFFARVALEAMPGWFKARVAAQGHTLCDFGCAEGAGTKLLAEGLGIEATGVDFSEAAIALAQARHAGVRFRVGDLFAQPGTDRAIDQRFDIAFSSNTLEHFRAPWEAFDAIAARADRFVVLLLPYRETDLHPEHFVAFTPADLPAARNGWTLVHAAALDVSTWPGSAWHGEQVLCIYARPHAVSETALTLASLRLDTTAFEAAEANLARITAQTRDAMAELRAETHAQLQAKDDAMRFEATRARAAEQARAWAANALVDRDAQLAALGEAHRALVLLQPQLERDAQDLARIRASRAWRWTMPFRRWLRL